MLRNLTTGIYRPVSWFWISSIADKIAHINAPLLVVHGERDRSFPLNSGVLLFEKAKEPKVGKFIKNAGHNDLYDHGTPKIVLEFLKVVFRTVYPVSRASASGVSISRVLRPLPFRLHEQARGRRRSDVVHRHRLLYRGFPQKTPTNHDRISSFPAMCRNANCSPLGRREVIK